MFDLFLQQWDLAKVLWANVPDSIFGGGNKMTKTYGQIFLHTYTTTLGVPHSTENDLAVGPVKYERTITTGSCCFCP